MKTKIKFVLQAKPENTPGWPHINFNYRQAADQMLSVMQARMPEACFDTLITSDEQGARDSFASDRENYDGLVLITATNNPTLYHAYCDLADTQFPVIIADLPHGGSGAFLNAATRVYKENLPVGLVSSMDYRDLAETVQIIEVLKELKENKILIVSDNPDNPFFSSAKREGLEKHWGVGCVIKNSADVFSLYDSIPLGQAEALADRWLKDCIRPVEPDRAEIVRSAKLYYTLEKLKEQEGCSAVTVDCLSLFYGNRMKAYPCLAFFEMLNNKEVGICEADVDSVLSALISRYGFNRPGFVSDPVIDTSSGQIIYDHCVCSSRMSGYDDPRSCEYYIRSHAEDQKGASVQTLLPLQQPVTTYRFNTDCHAFCIHSGTAVGNVGLDRGCHTKLAAESNVRSIMKNWNMDIFGWHRVTVYGDWRDKLMNLARMKGMRIIEEDEGRF